MNSGLVNPLPGVPIVESPFFEVLSGNFAEDAEALRIGRDLRRNGYAIFDFPDPDFLCPLLSGIGSQTQYPENGDQYGQHSKYFCK